MNTDSIRDLQVEFSLTWVNSRMTDNYVSLTTHLILAYFYRVHWTRVNSWLTDNTMSVTSHTNILNLFPCRLESTHTKRCQVITVMTLFTVYSLKRGPKIEHSDSIVGIRYQIHSYCWLLVLLQLFNVPEESRLLWKKIKINCVL